MQLVIATNVTRRRTLVSNHLLAVGSFFGTLFACQPAAGRIPEHQICLFSRCCQKYHALNVRSLRAQVRHHHLSFVRIKIKHTEHRGGLVNNTNKSTESKS